MKKLKHTTTVLPLLLALMMPVEVFALDYVSSGCDVRLLGLTQNQRNKLHTLRQQWKETRDQIQTAASKSKQNSSNEIQALMNKTQFDADMANKIAQETHQESIKLAVGELQFHHEVFHTVLNKRQRRLWAQYCIKN